MTTILQRRAADTATDRTASAAYERDFFAWTQDQAALLRDGRYADLDVPNLIDEVETLGRTSRRAIESRLKVLVVHLLKWRFQPERRSRSWRSTIVEQRTQIARELRESPSLRSYPKIALDEDYPLIRMLAANETDRDETLFPATCPFGIEEILDPEFLPEAA